MRNIRNITSIIQSIGKQKVFCVGVNKTGTTSLARALQDLGYVVAEQRPAELLIHDWARRDFRRLLRFCRTAQAFQDVPFSLPYTYQALDMRFPGSKFILTVRDSAEQWYASLVRFHSKLFGHGRTPRYEDLKEATYCYRGYVYETHRAVWETSSQNPYDKETMIRYYQGHNQAVIDYFRHRHRDLLVLNVACNDAYQRLCAFLGKPDSQATFPWENKTEDVTVGASMS